MGAAKHRTDLQVEISGSVTTLTEDMARVAVPHGTYTMRRSGPTLYEIGRAGGPIFLLTRPELSGYINERSLRIAARL